MYEVIEMVIAKENQIYLRVSEIGSGNNPKNVILSAKDVSAIQKAQNIYWR